MNNAIETATATTKRSPRPYWGEVTDSVIALSGGLPKGARTWGGIGQEVRDFLRIPHPLFEFPEDAAEAFLAVRRGTADYLPNGQKISRRRNPRVMFRKEWNLR